MLSNLTNKQLTQELLVEICQILNIDRETKQSASEILQRIVESEHLGSDEASVRMWPICSLYIVASGSHGVSTTSTCVSIVMVRFYFFLQTRFFQFPSKIGATSDSSPTKNKNGER
eukprot:TRINITY_DN7376_c0_g1_i1.p1 TRINITY_DN7376_c0_g1~~TRINITY_DN7376_c0_g1_i1.p1  ORF type:complete len:116 (-),score=5.59 TRINITY_DN7376_c0_g1_i1:39-386(-)